MTGIKQALFRPVSIAPLVSFRILFGLLLFASILRFWWNGWIATLYVEPKFHFTYWGFEWVKPLGDTGMHLLFASMALAALMLALGLFYRVAAVWFFLSFTYVELIDLSTYLNHYYFVSLMAFLLIWLPAGRNYALDMLFWPEKRRSQTPRWTIGILRFQMGAVYFFAGLAKLNADWLLKALPMSMWLPAKSHLPIVGPLMYHPYTAYVFSWFGAVYDLFIAFFLLSGKTRPIAYLFVLVFHLATALFFPAIGMFPYIMMCCSLIFFSGDFHEKCLSYLPGYRAAQAAPDSVYRYKAPDILSAAIGVYMLVQVLLPFRYLLYPERLFWHEEGYRFSWRVMLMEKSGVAYFKVKAKDGSATFEVNNAEFLSKLQEKMMSTQPDMILQYAHLLAAEYKKRGVASPVVNAEVYVSLNGRHSSLFIDPNVDLAAQEFSWKHYPWILPFKP